MNSLNLAAGGSREGWRGVGSVKERGGEGLRPAWVQVWRTVQKPGWDGRLGGGTAGGRGLLRPQLSAALRAAGKPFSSLLL